MNIYYTYSWLIQDSYVVCYCLDVNSNPNIINCNYKPYVDMIFNGLSVHTADEFFKYTKYCMIEHPPIRYKLIFVKDITDISTNILSIRLIFNTWSSRLHCIRLFSKCRRSFGSMCNIEVKAINTDIDNLCIFLADQNISYTGWVKQVTLSNTCIGFERVEYNIMLNPLILSYDIECYSLQHNMPKPYSLTDEIVMIGTTVKKYLCKEYVRKVFILSKYYNVIRDDVILCDSEHDMITKFLEYILYIDPIIIVGYNIYGFDIPYIIARLELYLLRIPINISRDNNITYAKHISMDTSIFGLYEGTMIISHGRISMDLLTIFIRNTNLKVRTLNEVSKIFLGRQKLDMPVNNIYISIEMPTKDNINKLIDYCIEDTILVLDLIDVLDMWTTWTEESHITYVSIQDLYIRGATYRACSLFYRECLYNNISITKLQSDRYTAVGGHVFEPKLGLHYNVTCVDFKSLYPSIMIEYNICISTYRNGTFVKQPRGILPSILISLIQRRSEINKLIKVETDPNIISILNARQLSLKICANGIYGVLSTPYDHILRFSYAADEITRLGRLHVTTLYNILTNEYNLNCVYGDTDSCYISEPYMSKSELICITNKAIDRINNIMPSNIKIAFERHVDSIFILSKKKYVLIINDEMIHKGNVSIRRDSCDYIRDMYSNILDMVLIRKCNYNIILHYILERYIDLLSGNISIEDLTYTCPVRDSYRNVSNQYNILINRLRNKGIDINVNDRLSYLYVATTSYCLHGHRMYTYDEVIENNYEVDYVFYLLIKAIPVISRLLISLGYDNIVLRLNYIIEYMFGF